MAERKSHRITVSLSEDQFAKIEAIANQNDASASWVVRLAVKKFLEQRAEELSVMSRV